MTKPLTKDVDDKSMTFPAVRGIQAGKEFYTAMIAFKVVDECFGLIDDSKPPKERAQRVLRPSRVDDIEKYIQNNPDEYVFSSVAVSVDGNMQFEVAKGFGEYAKIGTLTIQNNSKILVNDGQHRCAAISAVIKNNNNLRNEKIPVVFFRDKGLKRSQQLFADLNKHAVKPTKSLGLLYDHRDPFARFITTLASDVTIFRDRTSMEKSNLAKRSKMFFSLNGIANATRYMLNLKTKTISAENQRLAVDYWNEVARNIPDWQALINNEDGFTPGELRENFVHAHANILNALGIAGYVLTTNYDDWMKRLRGLQDIPWEKTDKIWQGSIVIDGKMVHKKMVITRAADIILKSCKAMSLNEAGI